MIDNILYAKLPPHLRRLKELAYPKKSRNDQTVGIIERELELSGLKTDGEVPIPTMATTTTTTKHLQPQKAEDH